MNPLSTSYHVQLPQWASMFLADAPSHFLTVEDRMRLILDAARKNFELETGGPFAAGIFESETGCLVSLGVNRVLPLSNSTLHAEMVAIALAQHRLQTFDLGASSLPDYQLVVNGRPCAMCFGAIPWSGVRSLAIGAPGEQIEAITGFDEGPIHPNWREELTGRGIEINESVLEQESLQLFSDFMKTNPTIYNGRST